MKIPVETKPAIWGAIGGAVAMAIVGFAWGGWVTGGTAETMAQQRETLAMVRALSPVCAEKFKRQADSATQLVELKKVSAWQQGTFIEKGGWATFPGSERQHSGIAKACAELLAA